MNADIYEIMGLARDISIIISLLLITITVGIVGVKVYGVINSVGKTIKKSEEFLGKLQKIRKGGNIVRGVGNAIVSLGKLFKK